MIEIHHIMRILIAAICTRATLRSKNEAPQLAFLPLPFRSPMPSPNLWIPGVVLLNRFREAWFALATALPATANSKSLRILGNPAVSASLQVFHLAHM